MTNTLDSLTLFDLDHTLLPIDSDHEWGRFLVKLGVVDAKFYEQENERFYAAYKAGTLNIHDFLNFALSPLASHPIETLHQWHEQFMHEVIEPQVKPQALDLVAKHQAMGDLCAIITATNSFVTTPIGKRFGIEHVIATEPEKVATEHGEQFTGRVQGIPNFKEGKVENLNKWLIHQGGSPSSYPKRMFYSDSMNDLPLLEQVTHPIATNPDDRLRQLAKERAWPILDLFA